MAILNQQSTSIKLQFESGSFDVTSIQFTTQKTITTLLVDKYFSYSDCELPIPYYQHIIGFLYPEDPATNSYISHFYHTLSSFKVVYRAFEECPEHVVYILCEDSNPISRFLLVSFSFYELFNMNVYLASFACFKSEEMKQLNCFNAWLESYRQALGQWFEFSASQKERILGLGQEIKECKEKQVALKQQRGSLLFGECLLCCDNQRSIVFLPCGHIVGCNNCTVKRMKIELNRKINKKRNPKLCPLCNGVIARALEVIN